LSPPPPPPPPPSLFTARYSTSRKPKRLMNMPPKTMPNTHAARRSMGTALTPTSAAVASVGAAVAARVRAATVGARVRAARVDARIATRIGRPRVVHAGVHVVVAVGIHRERGVVLATIEQRARAGRAD